MAAAPCPGPPVDNLLAVPSRKGPSRPCHYTLVVLIYATARTFYWVAMIIILFSEDSGPAPITSPFGVQCL
jgi:hypothetical protein